MKYILGLLFNYKKYKKDSTLRIYSNSKFVDEITLDEEIEDKTIIEEGQYPVHSLSDAHWRDKKNSTKYPTSPYGLHGYGPLYWNMFMKITKAYVDNATKYHAKDHILDILGMKQKDDGELWPVANYPRPTPTIESYKPDVRQRKYKYPKKLFWYELDDEVVDDQIEIIVKNDDNNYTNGFLTKNATITFQNIFLMPKKFFNQDIVNEMFPRLHKNGLMATRWQHTYYRKLLDKDIWPNANGCATVKGKGYDNDLHSGAVSYITLGGDLHITIPVIKKHGIKLFGRKNMANGRFLFDPEIINVMKHFDLINTVNEDKRSNNT
jgi:hypothetical protein